MYLFSSQPKALTQLISLYVARNHAMWKVPEVMKWLETNVSAVLQRVDNKEPLIKEYQAKWVYCLFIVPENADELPVTRKG